MLYFPIMLLLILGFIVNKKRLIERTMNGQLLQRANLLTDGAIPTPVASGFYLLKLQNEQGYVGIAKVAVFRE